MPEWLPMPKPPAHCPITSLSRSKLYELAVPCKANGFKPPVVSVSIKAHKHASRGVRKYSVSSLLRYLAAQAEAQASND